MPSQEKRATFGKQAKMAIKFLKLAVTVHQSGRTQHFKL